MMLKDSLYAKHLEERGGGKILEDDHGFIAYRVSGQECFIIDIHIQKESRGSGACRKLVQNLTDIALENGCAILTGNIHLSDPGASHTLLAALMLGFKVVNANAVTLVIAKDLGSVSNG
jgi:predicted GNAT superfamily acetyltransferase